MTRPTETRSHPAQLFAFGDSLSDIGRLFAASGLPLSPPYFQGRFSNGPVAVEHLAQQLGLQISTATDFALGGAQTGRSNIGDTATLNLGGLLDQVDQFKAQAGSLGAGPEDLYLVWAGSNDFLSQPADPIAAVTAAVANITTAVSSLAQSGAKNILVAKTPNLGRVPVSLQSGFLQAGTLLSVAFNSALETSLKALALPNTNIILADLFSQSEAIAQNPASFGFTNITTPLLNGLSPVSPTADPNQFFFWDLVHPTTRVHGLFADTFSQAAIAGISDNVNRSGGLGNDRLVGYSGNDLLQGRGGADELVGNAGKDRLGGGSQNDILSGGANRDELTGGSGRDLLSGGTGRDQFTYDQASEGRDRITDFQVGQDRLVLTRLLNRPNYGQSDRFTAYLRLNQTASGTVVQVDGNGDAAGGFQAIALLLNVKASNLTTASFELGG